MPLNSEHAQSDGESRHGFIARWISFEGRVGRLPFSGYALGLTLLKYAVDCAVSNIFFHQSWSAFNYISQVQAEWFLELLTSPRSGWRYPLAMLFVSLPFVWCGMNLIIRRLRDAGAPYYLAALFFAPYFGISLFIILAVLPTERGKASGSHDGSEDRQGVVGRLLPVKPVFSGALTIIFTAFLGIVFSGLSVFVLRIYGAGLFVGMPFCLGMFSSVMYGYHAERTLRSSIGVGMGAVGLAEAFLLLLGLEGAICLIMALPLLLVLAGFGAFVGHALRGITHSDREAVLAALGFLLAIPALMGAEFVTDTSAPVYAVTSSVEVTASPEHIWNHVVSFPNLDLPKDWLFRAGVAYPIGATIRGSGVGAERRCHFSTGDFVEPITAWDEPHLLAFSVVENPPPMLEWSFHDHLRPPHLHGFLQCERGEFRLLEVHGGSTRLEGTTWYKHNMRPAAYWRIWSDHIISRIHHAVLTHIRKIVESQQTKRPC